MQHQYTAVVGDKRKTLPTEIPQESSPGAACAGLGHSPSTLGMSMMDPELRTRGTLVCSFTHSKMPLVKGSLVPGFGRRSWSWVITDLEWRGSTWSAANTSWQWEAKCICMKNERLTGSSDGITAPDGTNKPLGVKRRPVALLHFLFKNKSYSCRSYQELLYAMVVPSHRLWSPSLVNHAMLSFGYSLTVFQSASFFFLLNRFHLGLHKYFFVWNQEAAY